MRIITTSIFIINLYALQSIESIKFIDILVLTSKQLFNYHLLARYMCGL